jgi:2-iminobutanoate/2-iminopropanoate deaminase
MMIKRQPISTEKAPAAVGPYSQAIKVGDFCFTAGQLGLVPGTKDFAGPDIESQTRQALENLKAVIEAGGSCLKHVVKTTVFLADMGEFPRMNAVYAEFFPEAPPARSAVQVAALPLGGRVEIEAVAQLCDCEGDEGDCGCTAGQTHPVTI